LAAAFAFLGAVLGFDAAAFFAVPAFFVIGTSQQINSQSLHPQGSSTATTIPHSSQLYRSPSLAFGMSLPSFNVLFAAWREEKVASSGRGSRPLEVLYFLFRFGFQFPESDQQTVIGHLALLEGCPVFVLDLRRYVICLYRQLFPGFLSALGRAEKSNDRAGQSPDEKALHQMTTSVFGHFDTSFSDGRPR
jgi:hypothetical protein